METVFITFNSKNCLILTIPPFPLKNKEEPMKKEYLLIAMFSFLLSFSLAAKPTISTMHGKNLAGFARIKVINETTKNLRCYVAIDGKKIKFRLTPRASSKWYAATDKRFNYTHFKTWCDFAELY